jgi:two-component system chemotaxis sensor kinase CheA
MDEDYMESYRSEFYLEAKEILDRANADMLKAEQNPNDASIMNGVFRGIHTVKGGSGMFEMTDVSSFAHELEGILNIIRDGVIIVNPVLVDVILAGIDHLQQMFKDYSAQQPATINEELINQFQNIVADPTSVLEKDITPAKPAEVPKETPETPKEAPTKDKKKLARKPCALMKASWNNLPMWWESCSLPETVMIMCSIKYKMATKTLMKA